MRIAVLSDIHGNLQAFEAVLADMKQFGPVDAVLVAGDITCGPGQQTVLERLQGLDAVMIQGNADKGLARLAAGLEPEYVSSIKQFALVRWAREHLHAQEMALLQSLPEQRVFQLPGTNAIRLVHGSPRRITEPIYPQRNPAQLTEVLSLVPEAVLICGHTHLQWQEQRGSRLALNPGAVSFSEDGWIGAQYALLNWDGERWKPIFRSVRYDLNELCKAYQESGFLDTGPLARVILQSILTGVDCMGDFFAYLDHLSDVAGCKDLPYYPDEIWEEAARTFPWAPLNGIDID